MAQSVLEGGPYTSTYIYVQDQLQDVPRCDQPVFPAPATSSRPTSPATFEPPLKCKRKASSNDVADVLLLLSKTAQERRLFEGQEGSREAALAPKSETNYGLEIAENINRCTPRQRSLAKLRFTSTLSILMMCACNDLQACKTIATETL